MSLFGIKGVHVPHRKHTADCHPERMPIPKTVVIPMAQHIGAPAKPVVNVGDTVGVGQVIGEAAGFISAPVHASVSGTVKKIDTMPNSNGGVMTAITIESDGEMRAHESVVPPTVTNYEEFVAAVRASGIVGLGGAGFPTFVKLSVKDLSMVQEVVLNGAECEPYITADTLTMTDRADDIFEGIQLLEKYLGVKKVIIGIEDNKPQAIKAMQELSKKDSAIVVKPMPAAYPQGGEKVLIYNTTGKTVPEGKLPLDVGCIVMNVTTLACIAEYVRTGMPLVEKCLTVDGSAVATPKNVIAPIGTSMKDVFDFCGGFKEEPRKVMYGSPMMGIAVPTLDEPILKNTNAILAFNDKDATLPDETPCIRCGNCINHCPLNLNPPAIAKALASGDGAEIAKTKVNICMECGACVFVCPAHRMIVHRNKLAKAELRAYQTKLAEQKKKEEENK